MKYIAFVLPFLALSISTAAEWTDVALLYKKDYKIKLERFDPPIVFEWGELITSHETKEWFNLYESSGSYYMIDRGKDKKAVVEKIWNNFEGGKMGSFRKSIID